MAAVRRNQKRNSTENHHKPSRPKKTKLEQKMLAKKRAEKKRLARRRMRARLHKLNQEAIIEGKRLANAHQVIEALIQFGQREGLSQHEFLVEAHNSINWTVAVRSGLNQKKRQQLINFANGMDMAKIAIRSLTQRAGREITLEENVAKRLFENYVRVLDFLGKKGEAESVRTAFAQRNVAPAKLAATQVETKYFKQAVMKLFGKRHAADAAFFLHGRTVMFKVLNVEAKLKQR